MCVHRESIFLEKMIYWFFDSWILHFPDFPILRSPIFPQDVMVNNILQKMPNFLFLLELKNVLLIQCV